MNRLHRLFSHLVKGSAALCLLLLATHNGLAQCKGKSAGGSSTGRSMGGGGPRIPSAFMSGGSRKTDSPGSAQLFMQQKMQQMQQQQMLQYQLMQQQMQQKLYQQQLVQQQMIQQQLVQQLQSGTQLTFVQPQLPQQPLQPLSLVQKQWMAQSDAALQKALTNPNQAVRWMAQQEITRRSQVVAMQ